MPVRLREEDVVAGGVYRNVNKGHLYIVDRISRGSTWGRLYINGVSDVVYMSETVESVLGWANEVTLPNLAPPVVMVTVDVNPGSACCDCTSTSAFIVSGGDGVGSHEECKPCARHLASTVRTRVAELQKKAARR